MTPLQQLIDDTVQYMREYPDFSYIDYADHVARELKLSFIDTQITASEIVEICKYILAKGNNEV